MRTPAIVRGDLRTPTGPFYESCFILGIRGSGSWWPFMRRSIRQVALFSAAHCAELMRIAGLRYRPGCLIERPVRSAAACHDAVCQHVCALRTVRSSPAGLEEASVIIIESSAFKSIQVLSRPESERGL